MRIPELMERRRPFLSLEFFPPKEREAWPQFFDVAERLKELDPLFVSVTYGAGGGTQDNTLEIVRRLKRDMDMEPMAHLTCVGASAAKIEAFLEELRRADVHNVLALRGDPPKNNPDFDFSSGEFRHASDLASFIKERFPEMAVAVTGYPEPHVESPSIPEDLHWTKVKVQAGGDFLVTQLFFDNRLYFDFVERLRGMEVHAPVIPGVLPILSINSAKFILSLCGASIPGKFLSALESAHAEGGDEAVREVGLEYAVRQAQELIDNGAPGVHLYTLNKAEACLEIGSKLKI
ncbi:5,10-methylenetetrahydrofolate reductase (NAD(P)) [Paucidesulfovibrio gracilis DSM 16080]|uniref:Methylenetetrahydrofolate reductase n=1 Tax=Paucidesulfovibrio gracilis DSM 16080 TaxID=1121449 RepID=A0A1T4WHC4_9BACT|nr:methylenetetrahydrofolate reductase [NAD(P)H] [Paucidesulfovibrio gracilis]SKA76746.1 5,10-methylenetetrahydrofolate reductase (NAD(P)) [Paucidesulfovibrio gracilis DSM 16080]